MTQPIKINKVVFNWECPNCQFNRGFIDRFDKVCCEICELSYPQPKYATRWQTIKWLVGEI